MPSTFDGTAVLITGAAGGIGSETARAFAEQGARLALVDVSESPLAQLRSSLLAGGVDAERVITFVADVGDEAAVAEYIRETVTRFGRLDVLVNNAGTEGDVRPTHEYDAVAFDRVMRVNVRGVWLNLKHAVAAMLTSGAGGSIVNLGSAVSLVGAGNIAPYVASKHAVLGLTRSAALELATSGIRVNAICPGPTDTRMQRSIEENLGDEGYDAAHAAVMLLIPMRRYSTPREIANAVLFIASDASSSITGAAIPVDGAMTAD